MVKKGLLLTSVCIAFSLMGNIVNGVAGQRYFFDVYNKSNNVGFYTFSIT